MDKIGGEGSLSQYLVTEKIGAWVTLPVVIDSHYLYKLSEKLYRMQ